MSAAMPEAHPFFFRRYGDHAVYYTAADERIARIRELDADALQRVLELPGLQKTVRAAATRRLRKLMRAQA